MDVHAVAGCQFTGLAGGADVEGHDHGLRGFGKLNVAFGDLANACDEHAHLHFFMRQLEHGGLNGFRTALHVRLDDDGDFFLHAGLNAGEHLVHRAAGCGHHARRLLAQLALAEFADLAGAAFVFHHHERLAGMRHAGQAEHFDRG